MKKRTRLLLTSCAAAVTAFGLAGCGGDSASTYKTYYTSEPESLNYLVESNANSHVYTADGIDGLMETNRFGQFQCALAKDYSTSYDETTDTTTYTFHIKENSPWVTHEGKQYVQTDGTPAVVKAEDFVTSAKYVLSSANGSATYYMYTMFIKGASKYYYATAVVNAKKATDEDADSYAQKYGFENFAAAKAIVDGDFSDTVGVKAVSDYELQYTVNGNTTYFHTALNYVPFYPSNADFVQNSGTAFGQSYDNLLYCGAYYISNYVKESEVVLTANPTYYDADVVSIEKIKYTYVASASSDTARTLYEAGEIDGFTVNRKDAAGWEKYVTGPSIGKDADGNDMYQYSISNPANSNTYSAQGMSAYVYSNYWNFDRNNDGTTIEDEIEKGYSKHTVESYANTQKAIANTNFRLAYTYGYDCLQYINTMYGTGYAYLTRGLMPQGLATADNKDYTDYFVDVFREKQGVTYDHDQTKTYLYPNTSSDCKDLVLNAEKSKEYADMAYAELSAQGVTFPIRIELIGDTDPEYFALEEEVYGAANKYLTTSDGKQLFNFVVLETTASDYRDRLYGHLSYDMLIGMGWGPDYADPNTYLNILTVNGDMTDFAGLYGSELGEEILGTYTKMVEDANKLSGAARFKAMAEAEYYLVYEQGVIVPYMNPSSINVYVSEVVPYSSMRGSCGLSQYKHKYTVKANHAISQSDFNSVREAFKSGNEAQLEASIKAVANA